MSYNTEFLISIFCTVVLSNIIIGFVDSKVRLKGVQNALLSTSGSIDLGSGTDQVLRLGELAFRWKAYAEYLMIMK